MVIKLSDLGVQDRFRYLSAIIYRCNWIRTNNITTIDINECVLRTHSCATDANCFNIEGSFGCNCKDGYDGDGFTCENIDECTTPIEGVTIKCDVNAQCTDLIPGFRCDCNTGYHGNGFQSGCRDVDECFLNMHSCDDTSQGFTDCWSIPDGRSIEPLVFEPLVKSNLQKYRRIVYLPV